ncbi:MAG: hypothetical protein AAFZ10_15235, partial [Pseudomonadota bacterium]
FGTSMTAIRVHERLFCLVAPVHLGGAAKLSETQLIMDLATLSAWPVTPAKKIYRWLILRKTLFPMRD